MKFKAGDKIRRKNSESGSFGIIAGIHDNPWDDSLHYSIKWPMFDFTVGYEPDQIDPLYELVDTSPPCG